MADYLLTSKDIVNFQPTFTTAMVAVKPGELTGSASKVRINAKAVCLVGDEKSVQVQGCSYTAPSFVIPGMGNEKIAALAANQKTQRVRCHGKALILQGQQFQAQFQVITAAQTPSVPPSLDPMPQYIGSGLFGRKNQSVRAS